MRAIHLWFNIGRKPQKITAFGASPAVKQFWRFTRSWVCHNHKLYYTYVLGCAILVYNFWWQTIIGYYRKRNYTRSLEYAILKEKEWDAIKPKEEDEEEYGDEIGAGAEAVEAVSAEESAGEDEWTMLFFI